MDLENLIGKTIPIEGMQCRIDDIEKNKDGTYRLEFSCHRYNEKGEIVGYTSTIVPSCAINEQAIIAYLSA